MLNVRELWDLQELTLSSVNSINALGMYLQHVRDSELKGILQRHLDSHIECHRGLVAFLNAEKASLTVPGIITKQLNSPMTTEPVTPEVRAESVDDRDIGTSYLLMMKRAGREFAWAAFETASAETRSFLEDAFRMCSHHAYEMWVWMIEQGYYPVQGASRDEMRKLARTYQLPTGDVHSSNVEPQHH